MPELPEVETTVRVLRSKVLSRTFVDVWTDIKKFKKLGRKLKNKKINNIWRRGKNIIFELSGGFSFLVHQKMTGHFLYGNWDKKDRANSYIHLKLFLDNKKTLAFSDLRKFAKAEIWRTEDLKKELDLLGSDPLLKEFTFNKFKKIIKDKKGKIKQVLMNQGLIAGIGNIYSDEILWRAQVHPFSPAYKLKDKKLRKIYRHIKLVLRKAVKLKGTSVSDYRTPEGKKGRFGKMIKVYQREGRKCFRCNKKIKRTKMGSRSSYFCSYCQKI